MTDKDERVLSGVTHAMMIHCIITLPGKITATQMLDGVAEAPLYDGLTVKECLYRYQRGMSEERVRTDENKRKYIAPDSDGWGRLSPSGLLVAQKEFTRLVREKGEESKKIRENDKMIRIERDTDYFNE